MAKGSTVDERQARMLEELERDYPESWIPKEAGEHIAGTFAGLQQGNTPFGPAHIVNLDCNGTMRSVWLLHEALKSQFLQARPETGEYVAVMYKGKREAKNPTPGRADSYHDYRVTVDRPGTGQALSWDALDGGEASPAASEDDNPI